jgi:hypothetical protein
MDMSGTNYKHHLFNKSPGSEPRPAPNFEEAYIPERKVR